MHNDELEKSAEFHL